MQFQGKEIKLGISIGQRNRHICKEYAAAGFEVAEMLLYASMDTPGGEMRNIIQYGDETADMIKEAGMQIRTVHLPFGTYWNICSPDESVRHLAVSGFIRLIEHSARWGATHVVLHTSGGGIPQGERPTWDKCCKESLPLLASAAKNMGIRILSENLPRLSLANTSEILADLTQEGELTGVCFDVNHLFFESHAEFIGRVGKYIEGTHLSDYDTFTEKHWLPGRGVVPWKQIYTLLEEAGYQGPYLFEIGSDENGEPYDPVVVRDTFLKLISD